MIATIREVINDRFGDLNKSGDIWIRIILLAIEAVALTLLTNGNILLAFNLSVSFFFVAFDYVIAYVLIRNGTLEPPRGVKYHWFRYVAKAGVVDNLKFWKSLKPGIKLGIRIAYFCVSLFLFLR